VIVAPERERRGLYKRLQLLAADLRVNTPQERLVLEVKPRLDTRAVQLA